MQKNILYQELWPQGRLVHLKLTTDVFVASIYKSFLRLRTIPIASIRHVEISHLGLSKVMTISYYKTTDRFITSSFPIRDITAWRQAFKRMNIVVD
jgi:hypothetical protein